MHFKQGDKAVCTLDGMEVEILYGPVPNAVGNESYLVQWRNGERSSLVWVDDLEPAPRFKVGQKVVSTFGLNGAYATVEAGPFRRHTGSDFYVLKDDDGAYDTDYEEYMTLYDM